MVFLNAAIKKVSFHSLVKLLNPAHWIGLLPSHFIKARAKANRSDWNDRTEISKAVITWFDADYEYELEIENEDRMDNEEFTAWVEENAESLAKADAESLHTVCEEIDSIDFTEKEIDDDALFDEEYENACEFEWECMTGR